MANEEQKPQRENLNRRLLRWLRNPISMAGVTVKENDYVIADRCGTVFIPAEHIEDVITLAEKIAHRQNGMVAAVRAGRSVAEVMHDSQFEAINQGEKA